MINLNEHKQLFSDLIVLKIEFFKDFRIVFDFLLLAFRNVCVEPCALLVATCLSLALFQMLYLLLNV